MSFGRNVTVAQGTTGEDFITAAQLGGVWPAALREEQLFTASGIEARDRAIVGSYADGSVDKVLGIVGKRYETTGVESWNGLVKAAELAGAKPTKATAFSRGSIVVGQFEVGEVHGIKNNFVLVDSFDGSTKLAAGTTSVRIVCTNTLAVALRTSGLGSLLHTASLEQRVKVLEVAIKAAILEGTKVSDTYARAAATKLGRDEALKLFDALFPEASEGASKAAKTKAEDARAAARKAAWNPVNNEGSTLATLWNAATFLVDRDESGKARPVRGEGTPEGSMLLGERGKRVNEVLTLIEVVLANGKTETVTASEALEMGVDAKLVGSKVLDEIIESYVHPTAAE